MMIFHIAQVNIGRVKAQLDDPVMAGFVSRLDEINAIADTSPGFVWRLKDVAGNATDLRPYDDDKILLNMSVWETVEALRHYAFKTAHAEMLRQRQAWFEKFAGVYTALWWVPAGHIPGIDEAKKRLAYLEAHGPSQFTFTFKTFIRRMRNSSSGSTGRSSRRVRQSSGCYTCIAQSWRSENAGNPSPRRN